MRQVSVLLAAQLLCQAKSLVSTRGVLNLMRWDLAGKVPQFAGQAWALVPRGEAREACAMLRADPRTHDAHITLVVDNADTVSPENLADCDADDTIFGPLSPPAITAHFERICDALGGDDAGGILRAGKLSVDLDAYLVCWDGRPIRLALIEIKLLTYFMSNPVRIIGRTELAEMLGRLGEAVSDPVVTGWVGRMNRKLKAVGMPDALHGMRGHGYRFLPPAE